MLSTALRGALLSVALARAGASDLRAALQARLAALQQQSATPARLGEASHLLFQLAERAERPERDQLHRRGRLLAERALKASPDEPGALLWWAAHRGAMASVFNPFEAVKIAAEVEEALLHLLRVAPGYDHAAADRVLGRLYQLAPSVVSIGNLDKAGPHLQAALARDPAFPGNQLFYALYLRARGDCPGARSFAAAVLESPELPRYPLEADGWHAEAAELLRDCPATGKGA